MVEQLPSVHKVLGFPPQSQPPHFVSSLNWVCWEILRWSRTATVSRLDSYEALFATVGWRESVDSTLPQTESHTRVGSPQKHAGIGLETC